MRYQGPATILQGTATVRVTCSVESYHSASGFDDWSGTFWGPDPSQMLDAGGEDATICFPDGRRGTIIINQHIIGDPEHGSFEGKGSLPS